MSAENIQDDGNAEIRDDEGNVYATEVAMLDGAPVVQKTMKLKYTDERDMHPAWFAFCEWAAKQPGCYFKMVSGDCYGVELQEEGVQTQCFRLTTYFNTGTCCAEYEYSGDDELWFPTLDHMDRTLAMAAHFREFVAAVTVSC